MAEDKAPDVARFEKEVHDVTCCIETLFCGKAILTLGEDEAELSTTYLGGVCTSKKRGPYGELGTVDSVDCCCFVGFAAGSLMNDDDVKCTGCGCDRVKVDALVAELKKRQELRGDRAKVRMGESTLASLDMLHKKMDAIMAKMEVAPMEMER